MYNYYGKLKQIWDELSYYEQIEDCCCKGYTCTQMEGANHCQQEEKLYQFLLGFDDSTYSMIITQIVTIDPLPRVNNAYSIIIHNERHHIVARSRDERIDVVAFVVKTNDKIHSFALCVQNLDILHRLVIKFSSVKWVELAQTAPYLPRAQTVRSDPVWFFL